VGPKAATNVLGKEIKLGAMEPLFLVHLAVGLATIQVKLLCLTNAHCTYIMTEYMCFVMHF